MLGMKKIADCSPLMKHREKSENITNFLILDELLDSLSHPGLGHWINIRLI